MMFAALKSKLHDRGPLGFATDALELAASMVVFGTWAAVLGATAVAVVVVTAPAVAWELLTQGRPGEHRCDADCAAHRTSCRNTEESS